jgi:hypothetical protein
LSEGDEVIFDEFIDSSFGKFHREKIEIANVKFNGQEAFIFTNCPCFVSGRGKLESGDLLNAETVIGYFSANGEDIPYGKPYAILVKRK